MNTAASLSARSGNTQTIAFADKTTTLLNQTKMNNSNSAEKPAISQTADVTKLDNRVDLSVACVPLTEVEQEAARNAVRQSSHTHIRLLPNHHINQDGNLSGFVFTCSLEDSASVLPICSDMFAATCIYECKCNSDSLSPDALRIFNDLDLYKTKLREIMLNLQEAVDPAKFDCIFDDELHEDCGSVRVVDERDWVEGLPHKAGVYHAFVRSTGKDNRDHRIYIVVSGSLKHAAEELQNLWHDLNAHITCKTFLESSEVQWLRKATVRNHGRIAAKIADAFGLKVDAVEDVESPTRVRMLVPSNVTRIHDMHAEKGRVRLVDSGCLLDKTMNGVAFDMYSSEGFWVFLGPPDNTMYNSFGSVFKATLADRSFPSKTVQYHKQYPCRDRRSVVRVATENKTVTRLQRDHAMDFFFPNEDFYKCLETLGYDRNNGMITLMPIVCCVSAA